MRRHVSILSVDISGTPMAWLSAQDAVHEIASGKVAWSLGEPIVVFHGGTNRITGERSVITAPPIIAIEGSEQFAKKAKAYPPLNENDMLFERDLCTCAYCGHEFPFRMLSRDHIIPQSRWPANKPGKNDWMNCVTACKSCNQRKDNRTPEEAGMELLYAPYRPCRYEAFLLMGRNVLFDQMQYLKAKLPKHSRMLTA